MNQKSAKIPDGDTGGERPRHALPEDLMAAVADDLRQMAAVALGPSANGHTLQPTAIVNEAWMRIARNGECRFANREAFLAFAAKTIRTILVDHARQKVATKRGGGATRRPLADAMTCSGVTEQDLIELEDELRQLEELHPLSAQILEMRFYGGMTDQQIAGRLGVTDRTVRRHARVAQLYFRARHDDDSRSNDHGDAV